MAEADYGAHAGTYGQADSAPNYALGAGAFINILGGVLSLALIAGVLVWGYQILARDVSGVPVVQALDDPMRRAPDDPGGRQAAHQGLAVNEVAAVGTVSAPRDRLVLAPPALSLTDEDAPSSVLASAPAPDTAPEIALGSTSVSVTTLSENATEADILALAEQLTASAQPLTQLTPLPETPHEPAPVIAEVAVPTGPGLAQSLRPRARPAVFNRAVEPAAVQASFDIEIAPSSIPAGTRLVQLGAFDSAEVARSEWDRLNGRFGDYMAGKKRVVQQATKAGRTFYRLRVHGFTDVADARRFCTALVAQNAACIPVLTE